MNSFPVYYINLESRSDRDSYMRQQCQTYQIDATRISATTGTDVHNAVTSMPRHLRPNEVACSVSHLRAIEHWLTHSSTEMALICEDDVLFNDRSVSIMSDLIHELPYYWDICQLSIIYHPNQLIIVNLHSRTTYDYSTACYLIRRPYAEKLMKMYRRAEEAKSEEAKSEAKENVHVSSWKLDYDLSLPLTAEEVLYRPGACLSLPLFSTTDQFESDIQTKEHVQTYHKFSRDLHTSIWKQSIPTVLKTHPLLVLQSQPIV